jgi:hypothetical protein
MWENQRSEDKSQHGAIHVSCVAKNLQNGLKHCVVQVECKAGCGYLIQALEEEADSLQERATAIQRMLNREVQAPKSLSDILYEVFPEFLIENRPTISKGTRDLLE